METDSVCISWIEAESRYLVSILSSEGLQTTYAKDMQEVIHILEVEEEDAT